MKARTYHILAGVLLLAFAFQAVLSMRLLSPSSDEYLHLGAGYTYLSTGTLRLNPEHPPLMKQLCALPLMLQDVKVNYEDPSWLREPPDQFGFCHRWLWSNDVDKLMFWSRLPVVLLGLLLGIYVYRWSRELFGPSAGLMALMLYAFGPNIIAHARFVTMDVGLSCFYFISAYYLWAHLRSGRMRDAALCGLFAGLTLASKFSGVVLAPVIGVLLIGAAVLRPRGGESLLIAVRNVSGRLAVLFLIAGGVVWAAYYFPMDPFFYIRGGLLVNENHNPLAPQYLMGQFRTGSFPHYFLMAFLFKTPEAVLLLLLGTLVFRRRMSKGGLVDECCLAAPPVAFFIFTSVLANNLGLRYILPVYPFVFVGVSRLLPVLLSSRVAKCAGLILGGWHIFWSLQIYPHHIAYFNRVSGGPARGHRLLDDSNVDWGQDLKILKAYLDENGIERVKLFQAWPGEPAYYGIEYDDVTPEEWVRAPTPGVYAINIMALVQGWYQKELRRGGGHTDWLDRYEPVDRVGYSFWIYRFPTDPRDP